MPYYLRYWIDDSSKQIYKAQNIKCKIHNSLSGEFEQDYDRPIETWFNFDEISLVGIASDGLTSLFDKNNDCLLEVGTVLMEVTALRNRTGRFLMRRIRRMLDDMKKKEIVQTDDISIAMISL